jgi:hypothetical protein
MHMWILRAGRGMVVVQSEGKDSYQGIAEAMPWYESSFQTAPLPEGSRAEIPADAPREILRFA